MPVSLHFRSHPTIALLQAEICRSTGRRREYPPYLVEVSDRAGLSLHGREAFWAQQLFARGSTRCQEGVTSPAPNRCVSARTRQNAGGAYEPFTASLLTAARTPGDTGESTSSDS